MENEIKNSESPSPLLIPVSILVAGALIAGAVMYTSGASKNRAAEPPAQNLGAAAKSAPDEASALLSVEPGDFVLGSPTAPVTMIEFADFQCPFCEQFFQTSLPQIKDLYIKTGKARLVFRDFAFLGDESLSAAEAARCAGDQQKFWEYHDYLYNHQKGENQGGFSDANLKQFAAALNLDTGEFNACLSSHKYLDFVKKETTLGQQLGVSGTPTTFFNKKPLIGAVPFPEVKAAVETALAH